MTAFDFAAISGKLPALHRALLSELSKNDQGVPCLDQSLASAGLEAVGFDDVKKDWYDARYYHQVRSCDALYKHGGRYYLIEFKTGKPRNVDVHRKIYDSVIGLTEHAVLTLQECRERLQAIIVSLEYVPSPQHVEMLQHFESGDCEPWDYAVTRQNLQMWDKDDIRKLSGFLVERIFKLSPQDFERFAANRNWRN